MISKTLWSYKQNYDKIDMDMLAIENNRCPYQQIIDIDIIILSCAQK